jgi:hypothetical protein
MKTNIVQICKWLHFLLVTRSDSLRFFIASLADMIAPHLVYIPINSNNHSYIIPNLRSVSEIPPVGDICAQICIALSDVDEKCNTAKRTKTVLGCIMHEGFSPSSAPWIGRQPHVKTCVSINATTVRSRQGVSRSRSQD